MSNHPKTGARAADNRAFPIIVFSLAAAIALGIAMLPFAAKAAGSDPAALVVPATRWLLRPRRCARRR
ncbi:MAG: hypothetical protein CM15mP115_18300 [Alphaproteobacteria bacterium]|nr:MAG: hypothetical protein CM15mP115_18300 [Alphaproteobacteria bacterium]